MGRGCPVVPRECWSEEPLLRGAAPYGGPARPVDSTGACVGLSRIGMLTGGGDAPGLNAVIRAVVKLACNHGLECVGLEDSLDGLIHPDQARVLESRHVTGILRRGGTILGTTNRGDPFAHAATGQDYSARCIERFHELALDALVVVGGDGTLAIAHEFFKRGMPLVGGLKTIDNDLVETNSTFGSDTAVSFATQAIDRLHSTVEAYRRVMVVEVMGRTAGRTALYAGVAGGGDVILIPEIQYDLERVADRVAERAQLGARCSIVVVAEGASPPAKGGCRDSAASAPGSRCNWRTSSAKRRGR